MTIHKIEYPFSKERKDLYGEIIETWKPGCNYERCGSDGGSVEWFADGMGHVVYTEKGRFKPEGFPERVFYVRKYIDPDGKEFGKNKCRNTSKGHFSRLLKGYREPYTYDPPID